MKNNSIIFFIIFLITACQSSEEKGRVDRVTEYCIPDSLVKQVTTEAVALQPVSEEQKLIGKVSYDQDKVVKIYPLVSGNVTEVKVALGDHVEKGQILAVVKSLEVTGSENDLVTAQANLAIAEKNLSATESL